MCAFQPTNSSTDVSSKRIFFLFFFSDDRWPKHLKTSDLFQVIFFYLLAIFILNKNGGNADIPDNSPPNPYFEKKNFEFFKSK